MAQVIVVYWNTRTLEAVVVGRRVAYTEVDAVLDLPLDHADDPAVIGQQLKEALAPYRPKRAKIVLAVSREVLNWQHLDLPPCPLEDLPDLVAMQVGSETPRTSDPLGLDFLPLVGDASTPHQLLTVSLEPEKLAHLQEVCHAADLTPKRIVPLSMGWPAAAKRTTRGGEQPICIFVAPFSQEATIWATVEGRLVLFRQVYFPSADNLPALSTAVAAELRRTFFALSQQHSEQSAASAWIVGKRPDNIYKLVETLSETSIKQLPMDVQPMDFASDGALFSAKMSTDSSASAALPLAGLALEEAAGNTPLVDLLHPRQRPAPRTGRRTYALVAATLLALLAYVGWLGYTELNAPVKLADLARAKLALLADSEDELKADEQFAKVLAQWSDDSVNILTELQTLSEKIRPLALDAEDFDVEKDVVLKSLEIGGSRLDIEAALRTYPAVAILENRLRESVGRVQRDPAEENESPPNYDWFIRATIDFTDATDPAEENPKP